jgi:hypothetical protein
MVAEKDYRETAIFGKKQRVIVKVTLLAPLLFFLPWPCLRTMLMTRFLTPFPSRQYAVDDPFCARLPAHDRDPIPPQHHRPRPLLRFYFLLPTRHPPPPTVRAQDFAHATHLDPCARCKPVDQPDGRAAHRSQEREAGVELTAGAEGGRWGEEMGKGGGGCWRAGCGRSGRAELWRGADEGVADL